MSVARLELEQKAQAPTQDAVKCGYEAWVEKLERELAESRAEIRRLEEAMWAADVDKR